MRSRIFCKTMPAMLLAGLVLQISTAQTSPTLTVAPVPTVKAKKGAVTIVSLHAALPPGFHANSNTPSDEYMIPLSLKWTGGPLEAEDVSYPKGSMEKYSFSEKPLSVLSGEFSITTKFKVPANAPSGAAAQNGVLRYQACNDRMCFAPKAVNVSFLIDVG